MIRLLTSFFCLVFATAVMAADNTQNIAEVYGTPITEAALTPPAQTAAYLKQNFKGKAYEQRLQEYRVFKLTSLINAALFNKYVEKNNITASPEDIKKVKEKLFNAHPGMKKTTSNMDQATKDKIAKMLVLQWKVNKKLYQTYGGTVIFQQADPQQPIGAVKKFLEKQNKAGHFRIYDPKYREAYWKPYTQKQRFVIPPNKVNFSKPWWDVIPVMKQPPSGTTPQQ